MKLIGYKRSDFTTKDGVEVKGVYVYFAEPINVDGVGLKTEKFFLSDNKQASMNVNLDALVGKEVAISYNKWQKPESIIEIKQ